jgi:hypothetical protein
MTDQLAAGTGDRVTFPDVLMKYLVNEQVAAEHRRVVPSAPRQGRHPQAARHEPGAGVNSMDRHSPLRERMISLRGSRLVLLGIVVAPLVMAGYVGLAVLLFLPLLGLRRIFRRRSRPAVIRWDGDAPWDAATRSA